MGRGGEASAARQTFQEYFARIQYGPAIREAYDRVNTRLPERLPNSTPEATFSNEVVRLLQSRGWDRPIVKPARPSLIEDVNDYYYIDLEVRLRGGLQNIISVMLDFQKAGLLIKTFEIQKRDMDKDQLDLMVTLSRLARMDENHERRLIRS
jgi:hypothetical protein